MNSSSGKNLIIEVLHESGLRAQSNPDSNFVDSSVSGLNFGICFFENDQSITLATGVEVPNKINASSAVDLCNDFNQRWRFSRFYFNQENNNIAIQIDFLVCDGELEIKKLVKEYIVFWEVVLGKVSNALFN